MRISNITNLGAMTRSGNGGGGGGGTPPSTPKPPKAKPALGQPRTTSTAQSRSGSTLAPAAPAQETKPSASTKVVKPTASSMQSMTDEVRKAAAREAQLTLRQQSGDTSFTTAMAVADAQARTAAAAAKAAETRAQLVLAQETKQSVIAPVSVTVVPDATTSMTETRTPQYGTNDWYASGGTSSARPMPTSSGGGGGDGGGAAELKTDEVKLTETNSGMKSGAAPSHDSTMSRWLKYGGMALAAGIAGFVAYKRLKKI